MTDRFALYRVAGHRLVQGWLQPEVLDIAHTLDTVQRETMSPVLPRKSESITGRSSSFARMRPRGLFTDRWCEVRLDRCG